MPAVAKSSFGVSKHRRRGALGGHIADAIVAVRERWQWPVYKQVGAREETRSPNSEMSEELARASASSGSGDDVRRDPKFAPRETACRSCVRLGANSNGAYIVIVLWIFLGVVYLVLFFTLALATFSKGHYFLFCLGIFFPLLWIIGALMGPTSRAATHEIA